MAVQEISSFKICIETGHPSIEEITRMLKDMAKQKPLKVVIIDDLQLQYTERHFDDRKEELLYICTALKNLGKELGLSIILLSKLDDIDTKKNSRLTLYDIPFYGEMENIMDVIMLLYRDGCRDLNSLEELLEINVCINKEGPQGFINLRFDPETGKFRDDIKENAQ
jgi:replicative DNA helicase